MPGEGDYVISDVVCPDGLSNGDEATSTGEGQSSFDDSDIDSITMDYVACPMVANSPFAMDRDDVEYEVTPHSMGRTAMPVFSLRPEKGHVCFSQDYELYTGDEENQGIWDYMTLPLVDQEVCACDSSTKIKTKRRHITRPIHTNEVPVENDRVSAIDMFLARG